MISSKQATKIEPQFFWDKFAVADCWEDVSVPMLVERVGESVGFEDIIDYCEVGNGMNVGGGTHLSNRSVEIIEPQSRNEVTWKPTSLVTMLILI